MHIRSILTIVLGAAALWTASPSANATLPIYNSGELFLGFRTAEGATNYLVNIGNVSQFANLAPGSSVTVNTGGNIAVDLATAFTPAWFTSGEVLWGIYGGSWSEAAGDNNVLYATRARSTADTQSLPWTRRGDIAQSFSVGDLKALAQYYTNSGNPTANSTKGTFQSSSNPDSWATYVSANSDFRLGGSVEGDIISVLDLYQINPATGANQPGTLLGTLTISSDGVITFTAVPEPSTVLLMAISGLAFVIFIRRRASQES